MGPKTNDNSCVQGFANKTTGGDCDLLASTMNEFFCICECPFASVQYKSQGVHDRRTVGQSNQYVINVFTTFKALESVKVIKATGSDNITARVLKNHANVLAPPLTAIFSKSLKEGVLSMDWKMANVDQFH